MKSLRFFAVFILLSIVTIKYINAQESGVNFLDISFEEAQKLAQQENKPIFIDAYATWCGPCKWMDKVVFTNQKVAELLNKEFINLKIDMEKGEGKQIANIYKVTGYPTLLFLEPDGRLIHRSVGAKPADFLMLEAYKALKKSETQSTTNDLKDNPSE